MTREIGPESTPLATDALIALRPHFRADDLVRVIDEELRPVGYRLVGVFGDGPGEAAALAVAGFRVTYALVRGRHLCIDEMITLPEHRGRGCAGRLMDWLLREGADLACTEVHLDSGVQAERAAAHRLYMRHGMRISAHHFHCELAPDAVAGTAG